jgi:predicted DNA-binding protein YlxM (UPF0122 family)
MTLRKTTSLTVLLSFVLLMLTSVILYIVPAGRVAYWANWTFWGLGKEQWGALHINLGILFVVSGLIHTAINWQAMVSYMKNRAKKMRVFTADFNVALLITLVVTLFTLFELPPIHGIQVAGEAIKDQGSDKYGEPPYGHAELSSLKVFCQRTGIDLKTALEKLGRAGLACESSMKTIKEIAVENNLSPQQVYDVIKPEPVAAGATLVMPEHPAPGFGRTTIAELCETYGLSQRQIVSGLKFLGWQVTADQPIKEVAEANEKEPFAVFEVIKSLANAAE